MNRDLALPMVQPVPADIVAQARVRQDQLTKPPGSLGSLEALGVRLAGIYGTTRPKITGRGVAVFAGDHGVTVEGVSAYPKTVTMQMVQNFLRGGAAINAIAGVVGAELLVVDVGVDADFDEHPQLLRRKVAAGTRNMLEHPAMSPGEVIAAIRVGVDVAERMTRAGVNLVAGGDMGIGNTTAAAAITAVFTGSSVPEVTGRGTGVSDEQLARKVAVIEEALQRHQPSASDPLGVLAAVGGLEIAALVGFFVAAAASRAAVVLDGFIVTAAALVAVVLEPLVKDYLFASHTSQEPGHLLQLEALGLEPLFDFGMRLGEGTGAVLAMPVLESSAAVLAGMATFDEANVDRGS